MVLHICTATGSLTLFSPGLRAALPGAREGPLLPRLEGAALRARLRRAPGCRAGHGRALGRSVRRCILLQCICVAVNKFIHTRVAQMQIIMEQVMALFGRACLGLSLCLAV